MSGYLLKLFTEVFAAQGASNPERLAAAAVATLDRRNLVTSERIALAERDARIYWMRTQGNMTVQAIADRLQTSRNTVKRAIKTQLQLRRPG